MNSNVLLILLNYYIVPFYSFLRSVCLLNTIVLVFKCAFSDSLTNGDPLGPLWNISFNSNPSWNFLFISNWFTSISSRLKGRSLFGSLSSSEYKHNFRYDFKRSIWLVKECRGRSDLVTSFLFSSVFVFLDLLSINKRCIRIQATIKHLILQFNQITALGDFITLLGFISVTNLRNFKNWSDTKSLATPNHTNLVSLNSF